MAILVLSLPFLPGAAGLPPLHSRPRRLGLQGWLPRIFSSIQCPPSQPCLHLSLVAVVSPFSAQLMEGTHTDWSG